MRAPAPALVVAITVAAGDEVEAGSPVAVLEAMKMEMTVGGHARAGGSGRSSPPPAPTSTPGRRSDRRAADRRGRGRRPTPRGSAFGAATAASEPGARLRAARAPRRPAQPDHGLRRARGGGPPARRASSSSARDELPADDPELLHGELEILTIFADLAELSRNWPAAEREDLDEDDAERVRSPREHFRTYLHSLDVEREGLPETFVARLARALAHYGVHGLERTPELEEAVYRIFLAHQRAPSQVPVVMALLDRRLQQAEALPEPLRDEFHETLDRLIVGGAAPPSGGRRARPQRALPGLRPARHRGGSRAGPRRRAAASCGYLAAHPDAPDRAERIDALVASPEPLIRLLAERIGGRDGEAPLLRAPHAPLLQDPRRSTDLRSLRSTGGSSSPPRYPLDGRPVQLISDRSPRSRSCPRPPRPPPGWPPMPRPSQSVIDLYLTGATRRADPDAMAAATRRRRQRGGAARDGAQGGGGRQRRAGADVHHFTFRPAEGGFQEERVTRELHPMISARLHLWRLANFDVTRLPSVEEVHLFHCAARENPSDERLVALAEVRDLTPVRDASGRLTSLPEPERVLAACLDGIRRVQAQRPPNRRLHGNRVLLYVWPSDRGAARRAARRSRARWPRSPPGWASRRC